MYMYIYIFIHIYMYICMYTYVHIFICTYLYMNKYICIYIYIYVNLYIYIYTYVYLGLEGIDEEDSVITHTNGNKSLIPFSDNRKDNESESSNATSLSTPVDATDGVTYTTNSTIPEDVPPEEVSTIHSRSTLETVISDLDNIIETNAENGKDMIPSVVTTEEVIGVNSNLDEAELGSYNVSKLALFTPDSLKKDMAVARVGIESPFSDSGSADGVSGTGKDEEAVEGKGEGSFGIYDQKEGVTSEAINDESLNGNSTKNIDVNDLTVVDPLNNGGSFKQLQYQVRQQRHRQQYQPPPIAEIENKDDSSIPIQIGASQSSFHPNLHLEMSTLANSSSLHSPSHQNSYSLTHRSVRELSLAQALTGGEEKELIDDENDNQQELLTDKAVTVIRRVMDKLTGLDFYDPTTLAPPVALDVPEQVDRLIIQATSNENLCLSFLGWCPFW
jgi:hypothetical protein